MSVNKIIACGIFGCMIGTIILVLFKEYQSNQKTAEFIESVNNRQPQIIADFMARECDKIRAERDSLQIIVDKLK